MDAAVQAREISADNGFKPRVPDFVSTRLPLARKFIKFCLVGVTGLLVDMVFLFLFADPRCLGLGVVLSKVLSAELAMINNFIWNELWTFRCPSVTRPTTVGGRLDERRVEAPTFEKRSDLFRRLILFNAICGVGIGFAVLLLHLFHERLGWNLYLSNLLAIILVTFWNFGVNARINWRVKQARNLLPTVNLDPSEPLPQTPAISNSPARPFAA